MGIWSSLWKSKAEDWIFASLKPSQVPEQPERMKIVSDKYYLSVFMKSARVVDVRKGLAKFYGAVHSYISLPHRSGDKAEFSVVVSPAKLKDVDAKNIDRVIQLNKRLLGPVPYSGGDL